MTSEANPLGTFTASYVGATNRPGAVRYPNGQSTTFGYYDNLGDQRLKQIKNQTADLRLVSQFDYTFTATGEIVSLAKQVPGHSPALSIYNFGYDPALQVRNAMLLSGDSVLTKYVYAYDRAGNRTREEINSAATTASFNNTNQLVTLQEGDTKRQFAYDESGNLTSDGNRRFEWDAFNRLAAIVIGTHRTEFSYDALNRRTRILEKESNLVVSDQRFIWCGDAICEERRVTESGSVVTKRFFPQGETEVIGGVDIPYFYTRDHLGSLREVTDRSGSVVARYEYDPFGRMTKVSGSKDASFGFAGYYVHAPSGLNLTWFRAYDPSLGRWISRDAIGENGGTNLYGYVGNDPVNRIDPVGAFPVYNNEPGTQDDSPESFIDPRKFGITYQPAIVETSETTRMLWQDNREIAVTVLTPEERAEMAANIKRAGRGCRRRKSKMGRELEDLRRIMRRINDEAREEIWKEIEEPLNERRRRERENRILEHRSSLTAIINQLGGRGFSGCVGGERRDCSDH